MTQRGSTQPDGGRDVALVTGASRGIGRATALALAKAGYDVAFTARSVQEGDGVVPPRTRADGAELRSVPGSLATTAREVEQLGVRALPLRMDLVDPASVRAAAESVHATWGPVRVLVNNAIAYLPGAHDRLLDLDLDELVAMLKANFVHPVALTQAVLPGMLRNGGGTVVNLCSGSATTDPPAPPGEGGWGLAYASAKAAFGRLAGAVNAEYLPAGVRAFNVDPGFVRTDAATARGGSAAIEAHGFEAVSPDAAAAVVVWVASHSAADPFLGKVIWSPKLASDLGLLGA